MREVWGVRQKVVKTSHLYEVQRNAECEERGAVMMAAALSVFGFLAVAWCLGAVLEGCIDLITMIENEKGNDVADLAEEMCCLEVE